MRIISHRGNLEGPSPQSENKIETIKKCLNLGFDVEVDLWFMSGKFYLGHDYPENEIDYTFFKNEKIWFHLKNLDALENIENVQPKNFFWHQKDKCTITSSGKFWLFPGNFIDSQNAIYVLPEKHKNKSLIETHKYFGVCTDYVYKYI